MSDDEAGRAGSAGIGADEVSAMIDGEVDEARLATILRAADGDPGLRARIVAIRHNDRRLKRAADAAYERNRRLPPDLAGLAGALSHRLSPAATERGPRRWQPVPGWLQIAAALFLALGLGWWAGSVTGAGGAPPPASVFIDEARDAHLAASLVPGYGTSVDSDGLQRLAQAFAHRVEPPDLGATGLRLVGVDVVPTDIGPALLFGYLDEAGQRFTLVLSFAEELRGPAAGMPAQIGPAGPVTATHGGVAVSFWHDGIAAYALVAAASAPRLAGIARTIVAGRAA